MLHMVKWQYSKILPFSHLTSPSVIDSANGGTLTILTSAPEIEKRNIRIDLVN